MSHSSSSYRKNQPDTAIATVGRNLQRTTPSERSHNFKPFKVIRGDAYEVMMDVKIYAFLDHTNINIMAQKASGRDYKFPEGIDDVCARVVPAKVFDFLKDHHMKQEYGRARLEQLYCYTSDHTITGHDSIGDRKITPRVFRKCGWNNREKIVDTYMVADAVETIFQKKDGITSSILKDKSQGIISLWTGDNDIICPVIDKARAQNWKVEVWSFKGSMSNLGEKYPDVRVQELDEIWSEIIERKTGWKPNPEKSPPINGSFKLRFEPESKELELAKENWREIVECLTKRAGLPLQVWLKWDDALMFLILAVPVKELHNYMKIIWDRKEGIQGEIYSFMNNKRIKSTCKVVVEGSYPHEPQGTQFGSRNTDFKNAVFYPQRKEDVRGRGRGKFVRGPQEHGLGNRGRGLGRSNEGGIGYP